MKQYCLNIRIGCVLYIDNKKDFLITVIGNISGTSLSDYLVILHLPHF